MHSWLVSLGEKARERSSASYQFKAADRPSVELKAEVVLIQDSNLANNAIAATVKTM